MPPPSAARPMPRPAPSAIRPKLLASPWFLIRSASAPCANATPEIVRMMRNGAAVARILMMRFMGFPSKSTRRSVLLVLDRHADVDHCEGAEHECLDEADEQAEQQERQRHDQR